jgi:hypothetical protein
MKTKEFTFSLSFSFLAETEEEARKLMQDNLTDWYEVIGNSDKWEVEEEEVEVSGQITIPPVISP